MDFGSLLHKAQRNENIKKEPIRYYSTKFEPPKKEQRTKPQQLSANIKKFLEKREQEEKMKRLEEQRKKEELLALRSKDKKAMKRVNVMLKRTKSANQSVIEDAVDDENTAVTLAGPAQPDEDDYGYVSQEASAFYNKMMEKYSKMPKEPSKFSLDNKKASKNLVSTKDRVRAALEQNENHKRKRKSKELCVEDPNDYDESEMKKVESNVEKKRPPPPPPMNFSELLKLAEKKQFEPIVIEKKPKEKEVPLTKKQKKELERVKEWQERRNKPPDSATSRIKSGTIETKKLVVESSKPKQGGGELEQVRKKIEWGAKHPSALKMTPKSSLVEANIVKIDNNSNKIDRSSLVCATEKNAKQQQKIRPKEFPPKDLITPKQFPEKKTKQFPPSDVRRKNLEKIKPKKRPILEDDEDSEMDDFIDDGPEEADEDYSKYIKEIFGYNKSKYASLDDEDDDIMETSFAQQMKEEVISTKMGIMEDLEDMKLEEEHKRRKALLKKKMSKRK